MERQPVDHITECGTEVHLGGDPVPVDGEIIELGPIHPDGFPRYGFRKGKRTAISVISYIVFTIKKPGRFRRFVNWLLRRDDG